MAAPSLSPQPCPPSPKKVVIVNTADDHDLTPLPPPARLVAKHPSSPAITPLSERRGSRIVQVWTKRKIHRWRAPLLMILFFLVGLSVSIAHCVFYPQLRGKIVGDPGKQEEKIRFGTAFAFIAQICLGASVWTAYTQWLWRTVKRKEMTMAAWNSAFSADTSILSLLNVEMLRKIRLGSVMAFFAWTLLLPPFFTPATLFIYESTNVVHTTASMPYPAIANASEAHRFAYSPPISQGTIQYLDDESRIFTGPRTQLNLITTATSSLGEILSADLPFNNSAYSISFFAPIVQCKEAHDIEAKKIDDFLIDGMATAEDNRRETDSAFYSFVPTYKSTGHLTAIWHPRSQTPSKPMNELWMTFLRPTIDKNGTRIKPRHYQICKPYNASYELSISQFHGVQKVSGNYTVGDAIPFPQDSPNIPSNMPVHAYTAFMWSLSDQLVGKFAWFTEPPSPSSFLPNSTAPQSASQFGVIDSPIQRTALLGSRDLDAFFEFDEEKKLYADKDMSRVFDLSDQRLRDKRLAGNRTLAVLVEELSFNVTVGMLHNRLLTNSRTVPVELTRDVNRYSYKPCALFIPYLLSNVFTLVCVFIGVVSYIRDSAMPGRKVQDIIYAARNPALQRRLEMGDRKLSMTASQDGNGVVIGLGMGEERRSSAGSGKWRNMSWRGEGKGESRVCGEGVR